MNKAFKIFIFIFLFGIAVPVHCYILSGPHLIELMTRNLGTAKSLLIVQQQIFFDENERQLPESISETLRYRAPYAYRCEVASETVQRIHVRTADDSLTVMDGKIAADSVFDQYAELLFPGTSQFFETRLLQRGIDISVSSIGRFQDKIAYVIGAQYPDETTPQIWIDKETFHPIRWIAAPRNVDGLPPMLEIRYVNWRQTQTIWRPERIEFYQNGKLSRRIQTEKIIPNASFPENIFDIQKIRADHRSGDPATMQKGNAGANEIQKTIENFNKIYE